MCMEFTDIDTELDELFSMVELDDTKDGEVFTAVRTSTNQPQSGSSLAVDTEGSHEERLTERSPCQGPNLDNTPTSVHCASPSSLQ